MTPCITAYVSNATAYQVWRHTDTNSASATRLVEQAATVGASSETYDDTTAAVGSSYYYWLKAANASGTSRFSVADSGYRATEVGAIRALTDDFDGDRYDDFLAYETAGGAWLIKPSQYGYATYDLSGILLGGAFGGSGATPLAGDFDGERRADCGVYQSGQWTLRLSRYGYAAYTLAFGVE